MTKTTITRRASGLLRRLIRNTQGQDLIEYALLFAIVTMICIVALNQVSVKVGNYFDDTQARIASGVGGGGAGAGGGAGDPGGGGTGGGGTGGGGTGGGGRGGGRGN